MDPGNAGISSGVWLVARASSKKFTLVVNGEDEYGEIVPKSLDITISTLEELKELWLSGAWTTPS